MTDLVKIDLVPAPDDQEEDARAVWRAVYEEKPPGTDIPLPLNLNFSLGLDVGYLYEMALPIAVVIAQPVAVVFKTWLKGRAGRRVRFKFGNVEIEAKTAEDVAMLVEKAKELQATKAKTPTKGKGAA